VSPATERAYLGTPVVDRAFGRPAFAAMFDAIERSPDLPTLLQAGDISEGGLLMADLKAVLAERGMSATLIERRSRARLESDLDPKIYWSRSMSAPRLQGMARKRRQLAKCGRLEFTIDSASQGMSALLDDFFRLEASGWKGVRKSALASRPITASIARTLIEGLARERLVRIHALRLDDRPLAMWIILYSGQAAFTWRTGYDESKARFSPGVLLLEDTTAALLSDADITVTDSCNHRDSGLQAERWAERHDIVDLLIDVRPGRTLHVAWLGVRERAIRAARTFARQVVVKANASIIVRGWLHAIRKQ